MLVGDRVRVVDYFWVYGQYVGWAKKYDLKNYKKLVEESELKNIVGMVGTISVIGSHLINEDQKLYGVQLDNGSSIVVGDLSLEFIEPMVFN